jgi:hypothetical protein
MPALGMAPSARIAPTLIVLAVGRDIKSCADARSDERAENRRLYLGVNHVT